jgi:hypothetical protein
MQAQLPRLIQLAELRLLITNFIVGLTGVTAATGLRLNAGETTIIDPVIAGTDLYAISASGTPSVSVMAITF